MTRFAKPSEAITVKQAQLVIRSLGESYSEPYAKPANAVPHRLIVGPMKAPRYKPPKWVAPIR